MKRRIIVLCALSAFVQFGAPSAAFAGEPLNALAAAESAFAKIDDYTTTVSVHETDGNRVQDRIYHVLFKKPTMERVDIVAGPDKGGGVVWLGGDKVKGHHGGFLGGIHLTLDLHNSAVTTLRGDSVVTATIPSMLNVFKLVPGSIAEAAGPEIGGGPSTATTLSVADPAAYDGVTREILYLSATTHLPVRRERFSGATLVKTENVTDMKTDVGLTAADFPW